MKILYMSCHEILEYDECLLFTEMGHQVYSLGAYTHPYGDEGRKRPGIPGMPYEPHFTELATRYGKELHPEILEGIDAVIIMHTPEYIEQNWSVLQQYMANGGRVIWRSIGQSIPHVERRLRPFRERGLEIVRYSPAEQTIPQSVGADAIIRFYKDPAEFDHWNGAQTKIINFTQSLKQRAKFTGYDVFMQVVDGFDWGIGGPGNEEFGDRWLGMVSYENQKQILRDNRVFFYHGTYPASYTLSLMEAMMTGIPVVAVGPKYGNGKDFSDQSTYEVQDIIQNGINGFVSNSIQGMREAVKMLLDDPERAKQISLYGRQRAIELFGKEQIKAQWKRYLGGTE